LVRRDLARSRGDAQQLISESKVLVAGMPTPKPASLVSPDTPIELVTQEKRWVSRGAQKMLAALDAFPVDPMGKHVLDVGSSTGGFTEVMLANGAGSVTALDVGRAQLHESLRADPRVISMERTNFRLVDPDALAKAPFTIVVADLSFISLCAVASKLAAVTAEGADLILLVKPQFEASKGEIGSGGVVRRQETRDRALGKVCDCLARAGLGARGIIRSPIEGRDGNVEYLLWLRKGDDRLTLEVPA
jgi:23S rRNA (cytidine1920-2'-O)/16S rRNA (cytidine1409-2'-O)-methyltransferase